MAIICPNIHHADWKKLVDAVGEAKAFLAFDRAQDIPTVEQAQRMFDARPSTETGRPKGNEPVEGKPGHFYRRGPETERMADIEVARQTFKRRGQKPDIETADEIINTVGTEHAAQLVLDPKDNGVDQVFRQAIYVQLQKRLNDQYDSAQGVERAKLQREMQRLSTNRNPELTEMGQTTSMNQQFLGTKAGARDVLTRQTNTNQDAQMGGTGAYTDTLKEAGDAMKSVDEKAVDEATKNLNQALRKVRVGKPLWQKYREDAANRIFDWIDNQSKPPADKAPVQEFTSRVVQTIKDRMKEQGIVGEKPPGTPPPSASDVLREAMANKEKYADVVKTMRDDFAKNAAPEAVDAIDEALGNLGLRPYSKRLLDKVGHELHEQMGTSVVEIAKEHWTNANRINRSLADAFVHDGGMSIADAAQVADDLEKSMTALTKDAKQKALERLKNRATATAPARKALTAVQKAIRLSNYGAMDQADMRDVVAKELKLPQVTPEQMKEVGRLAGEVETAPNEMMKARAQIELAKTLRLARGVSPVDFMVSMMAAKWLSGPGTWGVVLTGNTVSNLMSLGSLLGTNPTAAPMAVRTWLETFPRALTDARMILKTGEGLRDLTEDAQIIPSILGKVRAAQVFPKWVPLKGLIDLNADIFKHVGRVMRAAHTAFFHSAHDVYEAVMVDRLLRAEYRGPQLAKQVRETLAMSPSDFTDAKAQAESEGWKDLDLSARVHQILMQKRDRNLAALGPAGAAVAEGATRFALSVAMINKPEGIAGIINYHLQKAVGEAKIQGVPVLKPFFMFTNVMTNLTNVGMDWSPIGFASAASGRTRIPGTGKYRQYSSEEQHRKFFAAVAGSMMLGAVVAAALNQDDDPKKRWFDITGPGPRSPHLRDQLRTAGIMPWSIKIGAGNNYHFFGHSPLVVHLGIAGMLLDDLRYRKTDDSAIMSRISAAIVNAPTSIFNLPTLSTFSGLLEHIKTGTNPQAAEAFLARVILGAEPYTPIGSSFLSFLDRLTDPSPVRLPPAGAPALSQVPGVRRLGEPKFERLGEEAQSSPLDRFTKTMTNDPLRLLLIKNKVAVGDPHERTKIYTDAEPGGREMTPHERNEYNRISGQAIHTKLTGEIDSLRGMTPEEFAKEVEAVTAEESQNAVDVIQAIARHQPKAKRSFFNPFNP